MFIMSHHWLLLLATLLLAIPSLAATAETPLKKLPPIPPHPHVEFLGSRIQRTMTLLATSTAKHRNNVRILFYGQSIQAQGYVSRMVTAALKKRYPYANIITANPSLGGYEGPSLVRTSAHDIYPFYPDLVVFHVYGGNESGEVERILSNIRRYTTAEILTWTHHVDNYNGERDPWRDSDSAYRRYLAQKYDCELVEVREEWKAFRKQYNIARADLLHDNIHLNKLGGELLGKLVLRHFRFNPLFPCAWFNTVRTYEARRALEERQDEITLIGDWRRHRNGVISSSKDARLRLEFYGNRIDVVAQWSNPRKMGTARVLIDGRAPSTYAAAYAATRPDTNPFYGRTCLKRVTLGKNPVAETWTCTMSNMSKDGKTFDFEVTGSVTGPDGKGTHDKPFVSNSGRIIIDPHDFTWHHSHIVSKKPMPATIKFGWKVVLMGSDTYAPGKFKNRGRVDNHTVIQGIANNKHVLELVINGDGVVPVGSIVAYRPPM